MCCKYLRGMSGAASAVARVIFPAEISQGKVYRNRTAKITQEKNIELKMKLIGQLTLISGDLGFLFSDSDKLNIYTSGRLSCNRPIFKTIVSISVCWNNSRGCLCFFFRFDAAEERKEISEDWWGGNAYLKMVIYCERIKCNNGVGELNVKRTKTRLISIESQPKKIVVVVGVVIGVVVVVVHVVVVVIPVVDPRNLPLKLG